MNNELTITISRSYARKINRRLYGGNDFETADFWASYSEVALATTHKKQQQAISALLYDMAKSDVEEAMKTADMIGWWNYTRFPYVHPCFLLIKRELLDKTKKDFRAHPETIGSDHFAMITKDAQELGAKIVKLQDLGWTDPEHAFHLGGLTYPYQDFKGDDTIIGCMYPEALSTYNLTILEMDLTPEYRELCEKLRVVLSKKGLNYFSKYSKFFK